MSEEVEKPTVSEIASKGGKARAESMTPEQRSENARAAVKARWEKEKAEGRAIGIPKATHTGELNIGDIVIPCFVLENGTRVISHRGLQRSLGMAVTGSASKTARFIGQFESKVSNGKDLTARVDKPLIFAPPFGRSAFGYEGTVLADICDVILECRKNGNLTGQALRMAEHCEILIRGFAKVGIIALIDEATGYQDVRDKKALQAILDMYLRKEFAAWAKRFPDEFYQEIFRLRGWKWQGMKINRPQCVAQYTKNLIYERLAPGILEELETRNPVTQSGYRKGMHHQLLTDDVGHPALAQHLYAVIGLMRACGNRDWHMFMRLMDRSFPKKGHSIQLDFHDIGLPVDPDSST